MRPTEDAKAPGREKIFQEQPRKNLKLPRIGFEARGPPGNPGNPYEPAVNPGRGNIMKYCIALTTRCSMGARIYVLEQISGFQASGKRAARGLPAVSPLTPWGAAYVIQTLDVHMHAPSYTEWILRMRTITWIAGLELAPRYRAHRPSHSQPNPGKGRDSIKRKTSGQISRPTFTRQNLHIPFFLFE